LIFPELTGIQMFSFGEEKSAISTDISIQLLKSFARSTEKASSGNSGVKIQQENAQVIYFSSAK
jgi:hypothetical protein